MCVCVRDCECSQSEHKLLKDELQGTDLEALSLLSERETLLLTAANEANAELAADDYDEAV